MTLPDSDQRLLLLMRTRAHDPRAERAVAVFSRAGEHAGCWLALGAAGALSSREPGARRAWRRGLRVVAASYVLNYLVKVTVRRTRPEFPELPQLTPVVSQFSFPSAHATTSFAAAQAYRHVAPGSALYAVAGLLAASRPYLGVHYPSDVIAGAALGTLVAVAWPR